MFRRRIVLFIKRHKPKIIAIIYFILLMAFIVFIASIVFSTINKLNLFSSSEQDSISINNERQTIIYGEDVEKEEYESNENIISQFIDYCNKGEIKKAYSLISEDSKNMYYSTLKEFKTLYYQPVFEVKRLYEMQSWISSGDKNTYKVKLFVDSFDLGIYEETTYIEEYYTIIKENNQEKLSINNYIENVEINKFQKKENIKITILSKDVFMDYETYDIKVENNTPNKIFLDSKETTSATYLKDNNGTTYSSYIHEVLLDDLTVNGNQTKRVKIKFNKMYNPNLTISDIYFTNIIEEYENDTFNRMNITVKMN